MSRQQAVLGDVFASPDVLTVEVRLRLSALLAEPGTAPAILRDQLVALPLPADLDGRREVRDMIEAGLAAPALAALAGCRLDAVVPLLAGHVDDAVARFVPSQMRVPLAQHANGTALAVLTVDQICGWPGIGRRRAASLVLAAVDAGLDLVKADDTSASLTEPTVDDLTTVLAYDAETGGELRGRVATFFEAGPPEVRAAAARILAVPASAPERCLAFLDEARAAAGDERDRGVFEHGVLALGPRATRAELASAVGLGLERIRQLGVRAASRVDGAIHDAPLMVRQVATIVADRLGAAAPGTAVDALLASLGLPRLPDSRSRLLLRMAGPYQAVAGHPGWVAIEPAELLAETNRIIGEDGGVRLAEHIAKELDTLGIAAEHVDAWLARQPARSSDGLVVATTGSPAEVAERALHACGRPMAIDDLATWVPDDWDGIEALWSVRDRRFVVNDHDELALAEWGEAGDAANGSDGPPQARAGTLGVEVDLAVLGGASAPVSPALVRALGIGPGDRRTFSTRYGPVAVAYDADVPTRGSIRPIALAVGAAIGDELLITLDSHGHEGAVQLIASARSAPIATPPFQEKTR